MVDKTCVFCKVDLTNYHDPRSWSAPCFEDGGCEYCAWLPSLQGFSYEIGAKNAYLYLLSKYNGYNMCLKCYHVYDGFVSTTMEQSNHVIKQLVKCRSKIIKTRQHILASYINLQTNINQVIAEYALD
jgi:hypothetical protein